MNTRDTYKYELYDGRELVYVGISNDPDFRAKQHRQKGKIFTRVKIVGSITTRKAAHQWEGERIATYMKNHGGRRPRYNMTNLGDSF